MRRYEGGPGNDDAVPTVGARIIDGRETLPDVRYAIPVPVRGRPVIATGFDGDVAVGVAGTDGRASFDGVAGVYALGGGAPMREPDAARALGVAASAGRLLALELRETVVARGGRIALALAPAGGRLSWKTDDCARRRGRGIDARGAGTEDDGDGAPVDARELVGVGGAVAGEGFTGMVAARGFSCWCEDDADIVRSRVYVAGRRKLAFDGIRRAAAGDGADADADADAGDVGKSGLRAAGDHAHASSSPAGVSGIGRLALDELLDGVLRSSASRARSAEALLVRALALVPVPSVLPLARPHAVGGSGGRGRAMRAWWRASVCAALVSVSLTERASGCFGAAGDGWEEEGRGPSSVADARRERTMRERRRVSGDGESSSSESLQPRPVVRPMPPRRSLPSRWRTRRLGVSRSSLMMPDLVMMEPTARRRKRRVSVNVKDVCMCGEHAPFDATLACLSNGEGDGARDEWGRSFE